MLLLLAIACSGGADSVAVAPAACAEAPEVTWDNWGHGFFLTYCGACHSTASANRNGAPDGVNFDSEAEVAEWSERIRVRVLEENTMPMGGGVYPEDLDLLKVMLACNY